MRLLAALLFILLGYGMCYWQLAKGGFGSLRDPERLSIVQQNQALLAKVTQNELLLQFERSAENTLAKELAGVQDENIRLRQDLAFYQSILNKSTGASGVKLDNLK